MLFRSKNFNGCNIEFSNLNMYAMMQCKAKSENLAHILGYQFWAVTAADQAPDEFDRRFRRDGVHGFHLRPLGEVVDGDVEVAVAPARSRERSQKVQPPHRERPAERDNLESLRGLVNLLGVELAGVAGLDDCGCILKH